MSETVVVTLSDIPVMFVSAEGGTKGAFEAFRRLEARLPSLHRRRFYGTFTGDEYRACVALCPEDDPAELGLNVWAIPGGRYARRKMRDWSERTVEIGMAFRSMADEHEFDRGRPSIEFYKSEKELILLLPVK